MKREIKDKHKRDEKKIKPLCTRVQSLLTIRISYTVLLIFGTSVPVNCKLTTRILVSTVNDHSFCFLSFLNLSRNVRREVRCALVTHPTKSDKKKVLFQWTFANRYNISKSVKSPSDCRVKSQVQRLRNILRRVWACATATWSFTQEAKEFEGHVHWVAWLSFIVNFDDYEKVTCTRRSF